MFTKLAWLRTLYWCDTVVDVVGNSTRPQAIPLAMLTIKKETFGFHNFYAFSVCFSSLHRYGALLSDPRASEAPLKPVEIKPYVVYFSLALRL